jgi:hypothetical protein
MARFAEPDTVAQPPTLRRRIPLSQPLAIGWPSLDPHAIAYLPGLILAGVGFGVLLLAAAHALVGMNFLLAPKEVVYGEAVIFGQAERILRGESLYLPLEHAPYTVAAYTPIYYWVAAGIQSLFGATFIPGRLVSLGAAVASAGLVAYLAFKRTKEGSSAAFAALLFFGLGFAGDTPWFALYRVDVLGVALSLGALTALTGGATYRRILIAGILAAAAVLTKQTLIAATIAGFGCLWFQDRRKAGVFVVLVAGMCGLTALALEATQGAFLANVLYANVNPFSREALISNLRSLAHYQAALIAIAAVVVMRQLKQVGLRTSDPVIWYWPASALALIGLAKVGSNHNYWIELAAATAVLVADAASRVARSSRLSSVSAWQVGAAALVTVGLIAQISYVGLKDFTHWRNSASEGRLILARATSDTEGFNHLVERVRMQSSDVLAEPMDVLVLAGRPVLFEPYVFSIFEAEGKWEAAPLRQRICRGDVRLLVLSYPLQNAEEQSYQGQEFWPRSVLAALRQTMQFESTVGGRYVYTAEGISARGTTC